MTTNLLERKPVPVYRTGLNVRDWLFVEGDCRGSMPFSIQAIRVASTTLEERASAATPIWVVTSPFQSGRLMTSSGSCPTGRVMILATRSTTQGFGANPEGNLEHPLTGVSI